LKGAGAFIAIAALFMGGIGCGSHKPASPEAAPGSPPGAATADTGAQASSERPAPGTMVASPPEPITLESAWAWKDIWLPPKDLEVCTFQVFGLKDEATGSVGKEFTVDSLDNHVVFAFQKNAFEANQCTGLRVQLPNSKYAALWWACEDDLKPNEYPFTPERFKPLKSVEPGLFEVDLSGPPKDPDWLGRVRLIRIDAYADLGDKVDIGKLQGNMLRTSHWATVKPVEVSLKLDGNKIAMALLKRANITGALVDLQALGTFWYNSPWYATDEGRAQLKELGMRQGLKLLDGGDSKGALSALSAVARGSGHPVEFLYDLRDRLSDAQRAGLWPDGTPYLTIEDFSSPTFKGLEKWGEGQSREMVKNEIVSGVSPSGGRCAYAEMSEAKQDGQSCYAVPVHISLCEKPFAIRICVKQEPPADIKIQLGYAFPVAKKWTGTMDGPSKVLDNGWTLLDIRRDFYKERSDYAKTQGYEITGGEIFKIGLVLSKGPSLKCWIDAIEVCIP